MDFRTDMAVERRDLYRKANNIYLQRNSTNTTNTLNKNKRSASVPKLSIFNEKDSEYSEKDDNTFKIDF